MISRLKQFDGYLFWERSGYYWRLGLTDHILQRSLSFAPEMRDAVQAYNLFDIKCIGFQEILFLPVIYIASLSTRPCHFSFWMWLSSITNQIDDKRNHNPLESVKDSMVCAAWIKKSLIFTCMLFVLPLHSAHHSETLIQCQSEQTV